jgi:pimeloyl-ACP methyl ester carboxylesterase
MPTAERPPVAHRRRSMPPPQPKPPAWRAGLLPSQRRAADGRAAAGAKRAALAARPRPPLIHVDGWHEIVRGHRVLDRSAGSGPVVVLVHEITSMSATWANALWYLAERFMIIARDLLARRVGQAPRDCSLGACVSGTRDLLIAPGHERATFVGHSLGGGAAMPQAYQFPQHWERRGARAQRGLGRDITALRAASPPGSELVRALLVDKRVRAAGGRRDACSAASGCACTPTRGKSCADAPRSRTARRARRSCTCSRRSSIPGSAGGYERSPRRRPSDPVAARLGRARPDHPGRARARAAGSTCFPTQATDEVACLPAPSAAVRLRRPAKSAAGRRSTG